MASGQNCGGKYERRQLHRLLVGVLLNKLAWSKGRRPDQMMALASFLSGLTEFEADERLLHAPPKKTVDLGSYEVMP